MLLAFGFCTRLGHKGLMCIVRGSDSTLLVALSSGYSTHGVLREHKESGCYWVKWCSSAELNKEIVTVTSLFEEGTMVATGKESHVIRKTRGG